MATKNQAMKLIDKASRAQSNFQRAHDERGLLKRELAFEKVLINFQQNQVVELERMLKVAHWEVEVAVKATRAQATTERLAAIWEDKVRAVETYKALQVFEVEVVDGASFAFAVGFNLYKDQIAHLYPRVDVSLPSLEESEDEIKVKEGGAHSRVASDANPVAEAKEAMVAARVAPMVNPKELDRKPHCSPSLRSSCP